ncbi:MAG: lipoyl domain-containing protein [Candidatus Omnitrophica bacterium]|nr:lipoyl domain-containing protein [Candidatus Omnitrophota bacterium]
MEVKLPEMGEGIEEASISFWYKKVGDVVADGEDLVELTTEKTSFNLPSPTSGTVKDISAAEGSKVRVGQTLAVVE